jgi:hypothetical protein
MGEGRKKPNFQADRGNGKISGLPSGLIFCLFLSENCNKEYWICALLDDLRDLIIDAKQSAYSVVNATQTLLYWKIGKRINNDILSNERAEYGRQVIYELSLPLSAEFGRGFSMGNLRRMIQFSEVFPDEEIVASLMRQLSWTHFTVLIPIKNDIQRDFYSQMCRIENWSVRTLRKKIDSMLFERTAIS